MLNLNDVDVTVLDHARRAEALTEALKRLRAHHRDLSKTKTQLLERLATVDARFASGTDDMRDRDDRLDLMDALRQLERGPLPTDGTLPEVSPFVGQPGFAETARLLARYDADLQVAVLMRDHSNDVATYRLKEGVGVHYQDDPVDGRVRRIRPGDTVSLTLAQFRAFEDKFEPVEEAPTTPAQTSTVAEPSSQAPAGSERSVVPTVSTLKGERAAVVPEVGTATAATS